MGARAVTRPSSPTLRAEVGATAANRRLGPEATRKLLLDAIERVFFKDGHSKVSYRVVAAGAGVTPGLVQYYFPTIDALFAAMIRRLIDRDIARWNDGLQQPAGRTAAGSMGVQLE